MNRRDLESKRNSRPHDLIRLKHCHAVRIYDGLYTVKYGERGDYRLYRIHGEFQLIGDDNDEKIS